MEGNIIPLLIGLVIGAAASILLLIVSLLLMERMSGGSLMSGMDPTKRVQFKSGKKGGKIRPIINDDRQYIRKADWENSGWTEKE